MAKAEGTECQTGLTIRTSTQTPATLNSLPESLKGFSAEEIQSLEEYVRITSFRRPSVQAEYDAVIGKTDKLPAPVYVTSWMGALCHGESDLKYSDAINKSIQARIQQVQTDDPEFMRQSMRLMLAKGIRPYTKDELDTFFNQINDYFKDCTFDVLTPLLKSEYQADFQTYEEAVREKMSYGIDSRKSILIKKALSQTALGQVRQGYFENIEDYKEFYRAFEYSPRTYNRHEQSVFYEDPREEIRFLLKESGIWSPQQVEFMRLAVYAKMLDKSPEKFDSAAFQEALVESKQQMVDITLDAMIQLNQRADTYKETNKKTKLPLAVKPELFELPLDEFFKVAYRERPETKKYMLIREIHQHAGAEKKGPYKLPTLLSDLAEQAKP